MTQSPASPLTRQFVDAADEDRLLIEQSATGRRDAFDEFVGRYQDYVAGLAHRLLGYPAEV